MSRSGYSYGCENWDLIRWRGAVNAAIRGARGQAFLREMLEAMNALPEKRLIPGDLVTAEGCCAIGSVAISRGIDVSDLDPYDADAIAEQFGVASALVREIEYENDEGGPWGRESPEQRFTRVRLWLKARIEAPK